MSLFQTEKYNGKEKCPYCNKTLRWVLKRNIYAFSIKIKKWIEKGD